MSGRTLGDINKEALAIAARDHCGATIDGEIVLCCDARLQISRYQPEECVCLQLASKAPPKASPARPSTGSDAGDLVKRLEDWAASCDEFPGVVPLQIKATLCREAAASIAALSEKLRDTEAALAITEAGMEKLVAKWRAGFDEAVAANAALSEENERLRNIPVDVILHCPVCLTRHVDEPQPEKNWTNPPHRTHECQQCGHLWRPYDVATNGVDLLPDQRDAWRLLSEENERLKGDRKIWTQETRDAVDDLEKRFDIYVVSSEHHAKFVEENERLKAALEPFAIAGNAWGPGASDNWRVFGSEESKTPITVGDLRRAAALAKLGQMKGEG